MPDNGESNQNPMNPTVTIEFLSDQNGVKVNWNGAVKTLEFVLMMLDGAKINITDYRNMQRIQAMQQGIQSAPGITAVLEDLRRKRQM